MSERPDLDKVIKRIAISDLRFQASMDAGLVSAAEMKAYEANRAELIALLDKIRGTADMTYAQFRDAFEQGASCQALFEIRNAMHPKDPLKVAANEDLRSVGCYSPRSTRTTPNDDTGHQEGGA